MHQFWGHDGRYRASAVGIAICAALLSAPARTWAAPAALASAEAVVEPESLAAILLASAAQQARELSQPGQVFDAAAHCDPEESPGRQTFERASFREGCSAVLAHFDTPANFCLARFEKQLDLSSATFASSATFRWARFQASAKLPHTRFAESADFYASDFDAALDFYGARFEKIALFYDAQFRETVDFSNAEFREAASFYQADFRGPVSFKDIDVSGSADFSAARFHGSVDFSGARFKSHASFARARFRGAVSFFDIKLPLTLDLSGITDIDSTLDLVKTTAPAFDKKCRVNLLHSDLDRINIDLDRFQLDFPSDAADQDIVDVYEGLLANFERRGLKKSFRAASSEFSRYKYARDKQWLLNALQKTWWDYGFEKQWIFRWIAVLLLSFTLINNFFFAGLLKHAYVVEFLLPYVEQKQQDENPVVRFVLNLPLAFLYTAVIFFGSLFGFRRELNQFKSRQILINVYLFTIMASGIVCTMFILNFIMK